MLTAVASGSVGASDPCRPKRNFASFALFSCFEYIIALRKLSVKININLKLPNIAALSNFIGLPWAYIAGPMTR